MKSSNFAWLTHNVTSFPGSLIFPSLKWGFFFDSLNKRGYELYMLSKHSKPFIFPRYTRNFGEKSQERVCPETLYILHIYKWSKSCKQSFWGCAEGCAVSCAVRIAAGREARKMRESGNEDGSTALNRPWSSCAISPEKIQLEKILKNGWKNLSLCKKNRASTSTILSRSTQHKRPTPLPLRKMIVTFLTFRGSR